MASQTRSEASADWTIILGMARRRQFEPALNALVLARYARHLTLTADADDAIDYWWDAINAGALAGLGQDTAEWLYAVRDANSRYVPIGENIETHHLAQAMRASGSHYLIPARRNHREDALTALRDNKLARATQAARRALRDAVTSSHFAAEEFNCDLLADIYAAAGEAERASALYVRSGQFKALTDLLRQLGDAYIDLRLHLSRPAPWQRATAYDGLAAEADLVPDRDVAGITTMAITEVAAYLAGQTQEGPFAPSVGLKAIKALAALIERAPVQDAKRLIGMLAPLVPREPNQCRHSDEDHIRALAGTMDGHPSLRTEAAEQLLEMLTMPSHIADEVVDLAGEAIERHVDAFLDRLRTLASDNPAAARLVIRLDRQLPDSTLAREAFARLTASYEQPAGVIAGVGGLAQQAMLVRHLPEADRDTTARALLARARDRSEIAANRREALAGLRVLSDTVSAPLRTELFNAALEFARGEQDGSAQDDELAGPPHPLSFVRISLGGPSLAVAGLQLAVATGENHVQAAQIEELGIALLGNSEDQAVHGAALALSWLPLHPAETPARALAAHPSRSVRALAALRWARQTPRHVADGLRLAQDADAMVRRTLATAIGKQSETDPSLSAVSTALTADPRYSVRRLLIR